MPKLLVVMAVSLFAFGCSAARATAVRIAVGGDPNARCVDRLLTASRQTGYIEQTVDKDTGFFRAVARSGVDRHGRPIGLVRNFNVSCIDQNTALISPVGSGGVLAPNTKLAKEQRLELDTYASQLGVVLSDAPAAAVVAGDPSGRTCVADQLPEWQGATAAQKKALLERCRAATPPPPPPAP